MNTVMLSLNRTTLNAEAERVARDKGFTSSDDIDAFRHALWQATLTQALGEGLAQDIGDWNEIIGDNDSESRN